LVNWTLLAMVCLLVIGFGESTRLAAAYGISVSGTMIITTLMLAVLVFKVWKWNRLAAGLTIGLFLVVDTIFFASNATKIADGGWFPLLVALVVFTVLTTWATGRSLVRQKLTEEAVPLEVFLKSVSNVHRVRGTAVFLSTSPDAVPAALLHNLKHNQVLHERVLILTVRVEEVPHVPAKGRLEIRGGDGGFYRVVLHYGFMDEIDVPADLTRIEQCGGRFSMMTTSFFLGRQKLLPSAEQPGMALWREQLFAWLMKNSESAMEFFRLPTNRVIELGSQLRI
jgi:KUP system potassium uptake protein